MHGVYASNDLGSPTERSCALWSCGHALARQARVVRPFQLGGETCAVTKRRRLGGAV